MYYVRVHYKILNTTVNTKRRVTVDNKDQFTLRSTLGKVQSKSK